MNRRTLLAAAAGGLGVLACGADKPGDTAGTPDDALQAMDGFRKKFPPPQGLNEMNGFTIGKDGQSYTLTHLDGVGRRLGVTTRAECMALLTYLTDPDDKIRFVAAFAIEAAVKAYPGGMSTSDIQKVDSEGHRAMVKKFIAGIEKLKK
jgi:hypothetical protein